MIYKRNTYKKSRKKIVRKILPMIIHNRHKNEEEDLVCLVGLKGKFMGFADAKKALRIIKSHEKRTGERLNMFRRMQLVNLKHDCRYVRSGYAQ